MKRVLISALTATLLNGIALYAASTEAQSPVTHRTQSGLQYYSQNEKSAKKYVSEEMERHHRSVMRQAPRKLLKAFSDTYRALKLIQVGQDQDALRFLESADRAFEETLRQNPELKMIPLSEQIYVSELEADAAEIKKAVDYGRELLTGYHTQAASSLVATLRDEMDIATSYLPLELYSQSIKKAIGALRANDHNGAVEALEGGLGTIVTLEAIIPLPLLAAQKLLRQASQTEKRDKTKVHELLDAAKEELRRGYYLGYTDLHTAAYNDLMRQILAIEKEMGGANDVEPLYRKIRESFEQLVDQSYHDSVERREAQALNDPTVLSAKRSAQAGVEEEEARELFDAELKAPLFEREARSDANNTLR